MGLVGDKVGNVASIHWLGCMLYDWMVEFHKRLGW